MPKNRPITGGFTKYVDAKSAAICADVGKVDVVAGVQFLLLILGQNFEHVTFELGVRQLAKFDRHQVAIHAQHRRHADGQVHVGTALCEAEFQERINASHDCLYLQRFQRFGEFVH